MWVKQGSWSRNEDQEDDNRTHRTDWAIVGPSWANFLLKARFSVSLREIKTRGGKEYGGKGDQ